MQFSVKEWRYFYDKVQELSNILRDSKSALDEKGDVIPPKNVISNKECRMIENRIEALLQRCSQYLDQCGMLIRPPLWRYDPKNPETHSSSTKFKYGHLLPERFK